MPSVFSNWPDGSAAGGGGSAIETQDDGSQIVADTDTLNFTGAGVVVTNPSGNVTEINIPGGGAVGGSSTVELLSTLDFTASPVSQFDVTDVDQYDEIVLIASGVDMSADQAWLCRVSTDGGTSFDSTAANYHTRAELGSTVGLSSATGFEVLSGSHTGARHLVAHFYNPGTAAPTSFNANPAGGSGNLYFFMGQYGSTAQHDALRFLSASGANFNSGTAYILGIRHTSSVSMPTEETGTTYSLTNADLTGEVVRRFSNASAITLTVTASLTNKQPITVIQTGAGTLTFAEDTGVTIQSLSGNLSLSGQYASATLIPDADTADLYYLIGALA